MQLDHERRLTDTKKEALKTPLRLPVEPAAS
jgi:hypothetical protein